MPLASRLSVNPYFRLMRLHQPAGIWLLLWPCLWSVALASHGKPDLFIMGLYALGALVMRSAGCIINDMWDREFDIEVERTKDRPLASGELSMEQALSLLIILLCIAFLIALSLGLTTTLLAACALPLVIIYPLMKRITWWPQLFLGLTFNWGALLGWVSVHNEVGLPALLLYAGGIFWTIGYDTVYAHQDIVDDIRIGVKSSARKLGAYTKPFVALCYSCFAVLLTIAMMQVTPPSAYGIFCIILGWGLMIGNLVDTDLTNREQCKLSFKMHTKLALLFFIAILAS